MRNFNDCLLCIETLWGQSVLNLYFHLKGGRRDGQYIDLQCNKIKNCTTINHILVEKGLFDTGFEARLPEIQEHDLENSIRQFALPFLRERQSLVEKYRGEDHVRDVATTVYRSPRPHDGGEAGSYQSVPQIVEGWIASIKGEVLSSSDDGRTENLQAAQERERAIASYHREYFFDDCERELAYNGPY